MRIRIELDTDPPPLAEYEVLPLLTPIPFHVRLFDLPCLFAGKLHAILCRDWQGRVKGRDFYDFLWYLGRQIPCNVRHLQARMTQTDHWKQARELDAVQLRQLLRRRFQQVDFEQARSDVRPFIRDDADLQLWDSAFFQSVAGRVAAASHGRHDAQRRGGGAHRRHTGFIGGRLDLCAICWTPGCAAGSGATAPTLQRGQRPADPELTRPAIEALDAGAATASGTD